MNAIERINESFQRLAQAIKSSEERAVSAAVAAERKRCADICKSIANKHHKRAAKFHKTGCYLEADKEALSQSTAEQCLREIDAHG